MGARLLPQASLLLCNIRTKITPTQNANLSVTIDRLKFDLTEQVVMKFTIIERASHFTKLKQKSGHGDAISLVKIRYGNSPMCFFFLFSILHCGNVEN